MRKQSSKAELNTTEDGYNTWDFLVRYITPVMVLIVFLNVIGVIKV
jgi:SNF family Na+-dependent transporter